MSIKTQIEADLKTALLNNEREKVETLRGLKAALLNEEVARSEREAGLDDEVALQIIAREAKKRKESIQLYQANQRGDLAENEERELAIIGSYLPQQLDESETVRAVEQAIKQLAAVDMKQMGQVINAVKQKHGTSVDGALVAKITKEKLQQQG